MSELIKELRERTGAGFVDCKKALEATENNIEAAIEWLQKHGAAKAVKKAGNIAAEGLVNIVQNAQVAVIYEVNAQTDFVARNKDFQQLVKHIGEILLAHDFETTAAALQLKDRSGRTIEDLTTSATAVIGEKISFRRAVRVAISTKSPVGTYVHFDGRKAALFQASAGSEELLRGIAMHITAMQPEFLNEQAVPAAQLNQLKAQLAQAPDLQNKPEAVRTKMLAGRLRKTLSETVLVEQDYVVEPGKTIGQLLNEVQATPLAMYRFEVGEGLEKQTVDFAAEVAAQMKK